MESCGRSAACSCWGLSHSTTESPVFKHQRVSCGYYSNRADGGRWIWACCLLSELLKAAVTLWGFVLQHRCYLELLNILLIHISASLHYTHAIMARSVRTRFHRRLLSQLKLNDWMMHLCQILFYGSRKLISRKRSLLPFQLCNQVCRRSPFHFVPKLSPYSASRSNRGTRYTTHTHTHETTNMLHKQPGWWTCVRRDLTLGLIHRNLVRLVHCHFSFPPPFLFHFARMLQCISNTPWSWRRLPGPTWRCLCGNICAALCGSVWWTGRKRRGQRTCWKVQRWRGCGWGSETPCPPGRRGRTSTTNPAGSTESSRWWSRARSRRSFSESAFELWECCCWSSGDPAHPRTLKTEGMTKGWAGTRAGHVSYFLLIY